MPARYAYKTYAQMTKFTTLTDIPMSIPKLQLHPQAQLPTRRPSRHPIHTRMKLRNSRHSRDPFSTQLRQLLAFRSVYIHKSIHIPNHEPLNPIFRLQLPLRAEDSDPAAGLVVMWDDGGRIHFIFRELVSDFPIWST